MAALASTYVFQAAVRAGLSQVALRTCLQIAGSSCTGRDLLPSSLFRFHSCPVFRAILFHTDPTSGYPPTSLTHLTCDQRGGSHERLKRPRGRPVVVLGVQPRGLYVREGVHQGIGGQRLWEGQGGRLFRQRHATFQAGGVHQESGRRERPMKNQRGESFCAGCLFLRFQRGSEWGLLGLPVQARCTRKLVA